MAAKSRKITLKEAFQKGFLMGCACASHSNIRPETLVDDVVGGADGGTGKRGRNESRESWEVTSARAGGVSHDSGRKSPHKAWSDEP